MKRKYKNMAAVTMAAAVACAAQAKAGTVVGDWQTNSLITDFSQSSVAGNTGSSNGWFDWQLSNGGSSPSNDAGAGASTDPGDYFPSGSSSSYTTYNYSTTTGVTLGTQSLKVTPTSGYSQNLSLKTNYETDSEGNNEMGDFFNNTEFTIQVTYNAEEWSPNAGAISGITLNAATYGFRNWPTSYPNNSIGGPNYDTGNPGNPGNWDAKDYASPTTNGITSRTMTWSYANELPGGSGNPAAVSGSDPTGTIPANASYVELIMATILYDSSETIVPGSFYFSNAQFTNTQVNTSWQALQHAQGTSYNWGTINNFTPYNQATLTGGMPCNAGDIVTFGTDIPTGITETIDLNATRDFQISVGTMIFDNLSSSYLIDQGTAGTLTLNGNVTSPAGTTTAGASAIVDEGGNHTISAPVALATTASVAVTTGSVFTMSGNVTGTGALIVGPLTLPKSEGAADGGGTLILSGANSYSGGTAVSAGTLLLNAGASLPQNKPLAITGGNVVLATGITAGSQSANVPATAPTSNVNISSLAISGSGTLNINNNHIIINYGSGTDPIGSIAMWIADGAYGSGTTVTWTGTGITSSAAAANPNYGIGYADANDAGNPAGLAAGQIEIMYTLLGDANLDGKVNGSDFNLMATNFNQAVTAGWDKGDFNYDGKVNGNDFVLLAANFNQFASQSAISSADETALNAFAEANGISLASVPEPASAGLLLVAGLGVLRRRRRSSRQDD